MYTDAEDIILQYKLRPKQFGLDTDQNLNELVTKWIGQASNAIDKFLGRSISYPPDNVPEVIVLACTEAVGNIITNRRLRQDGSYIKSDDWSRENPSPLDILYGVRELLEPIKDSNSRVDCFAVTWQDVLDDEKEANKRGVRDYDQI